MTGIKQTVFLILVVFSVVILTGSNAFGATPYDTTSSDAETDGVNGFRELDGAKAVSVFQLANGTNFALVASYDDDGIQLINLNNPTNIVAVTAKTDGVSGYTALDGAADAKSFSIGDKRYGVVVSGIDDGIQLLNMTNPLKPAPLDAEFDGPNGFSELDGANSVNVFTLSNGTNYSLVTSYDDDGFQLVNMNDPTAIVAVDSETDGSNGFTKLDGPSDSATFSVSGNPHGIITSKDESYFTIINLSDPSNVTMVKEYDLSSDSITSPTSVDVFTKNSKNYAAIRSETGKQFAIYDITVLTNPELIDSISDTSSTILGGSGKVGIFTVGSSQFALSTSSTEDGFEIINLNELKLLHSANSQTDGTNEFAELDGASGFDFFTDSGKKYAIIASSDDDGVQIIEIGTLPAITSGQTPDSINQFSKISVNNNGLSYQTDSDIFYTSNGSRYLITTFGTFENNQVNDGFAIYDIDDLSNPSQVTRFANGWATIFKNKIVNMIEVKALEINTHPYLLMRNSLTSLLVVNATDPSNLTITDELTSSTTAKWISKSNLATFQYSNGTNFLIGTSTDVTKPVVLYNLNDPSNITFSSVAPASVPNYASNISTFKLNNGTNFAAVVTGSDDYIRILNLNDLSDIKLVDAEVNQNNSIFNLGDNVGRIETFQLANGTNYAFTAEIDNTAGDTPISIINLNDPANIYTVYESEAVLCSHWKIRDLFTYNLQNGTNYVGVSALGANGLTQFNLNDPANPQNFGCQATGVGGSNQYDWNRNYFGFIFTVNPFTIFDNQYLAITSNTSWNACGSCQRSAMSFWEVNTLNPIPSQTLSLVATKDSAIPTTKINLSWAAPTYGMSPTGYKIEQSTDSGATWSAITANTASPATIYSATGLTPNSTYQFRVSAINGLGTGTVSASSTGVTTSALAAPSGITNLTFTHSDSLEFTLSWSAPYDGGVSITDYEIYQSTDGTTYTQYSDAVDTQTSEVISGLSYSNTYFFKVKAKNSQGTSVIDSNVVSKQLVAPINDTTPPSFTVNGNSADFTTTLVRGVDTYNYGTIANVVEEQTYTTSQNTEMHFPHHIGGEYVYERDVPLDGTIPPPSYAQKIFYTRYTLTETSGNQLSHTITEKVVMSPGNTPVIKLDIDALVRIDLNAPIPKFAYSASDVEDGDITSSVIVDSSAVDTSTRGKYKVYFTVTDSSGNTKVPTQTVVVDNSSNINLAKGGGASNFVVADNTGFNLIPSLSTSETFEVSSGVKLDFSNYANDQGAVTLTSQITLDSTVADVVLPSSVQISSAAGTWTGELTAPTPKTITSLIFTPTVSVEFGNPNGRLSFSAPVKIILPGAAGSDGLITEFDGTEILISTTCDDLTNPTNVGTTACKIDSGDDLVIWTKTASTFSAGSNGVVVTSNGGSSVCGSKCAPSFTTSFTDEFPLIINGKSYTYDEIKNIESINIQKGDSLSIILKSYVSIGPEFLEHVSLFFTDSPQIKNDLTETSVTYQKGKESSIKDPQELIDTAFVKSYIDGNKAVVEYDVKFTKFDFESDLFFRLWDSNRNVSYLYIEDVLESEMTQKQSMSTSSQSVIPQKEISKEYEGEEEISEYLKLLEEKRIASEIARNESILLKESKLQRQNEIIAKAMDESARQLELAQKQSDDTIQKMLETADDKTQKYYTKMLEDKYKQNREFQEIIKQKAEIDLQKTKSEIKEKKAESMNFAMSLNNNEHLSNPSDYLDSLENDRTIIPEKIKNELALLDIKYLEMIQNKMNIEKMRIQNTLDYERQIIEKIYSERKEFREINYEKIKSYDRIMNSPNIDLKQTEKTSSSSDIPYWVKDNAKWWADGVISEKDFILGMEYLVNHGIIQGKKILEN